MARLRMAAPPIGPAVRQVDLAEDEVDHPVHEIVLVGEVVVEGHRLDPELLAELAHRECLEPALVGALDGGLQAPAPA